MASNQDNSKKTKRGPPQPWVVNSFGVSSPSSSKPPKQQQRTLMSAPAFAISPRGGGGGGPSKSTRAEHDDAAGDQAETPVKKLRREGDGGLQVVEDDNSVDTEPGSAAESSSTSTRPHPLAQPTPLVRRPPPKPLTTTPSRHLPPPPPPAYHLPRPPGPPTISPHRPSKPLSRISDLLPSPLAPSPIKPDPSLEHTSVKKKPLTVGLSGIAAGKIRVGEEGEGGGEGSGGGGGGGMIMGVDEWAMGMLNGKSPSKGKKAFKGILPLTSSTSLLLSSHSTSLKHFFTPTSNNPRRPHEPDLHLLVLSIAPPEPISKAQFNPRLLRTICRILPPPRRPRSATTVVESASTSDSMDPFALPPPSTTTTTSNDGDVQPQPQPKADEDENADDEMEEEESIGTVLLMLPADGSLGVGRKEGVGAGKTVRGWRPWLEVDVGGDGNGGERVLMLDRFEVE